MLGSMVDTAQVLLSTVDPGTAGPRDEARLFDFLSTRAAAARP